MKNFDFKGEIPVSKSLMNRALIVQSYFPDLKIIGDSDCEDVAHMKSALGAFSEQQEMFCGDGGTTFRFSALRASRKRGEWNVSGSARLFERPQKDLLSLLGALGVQANIDNRCLILHGEGWKKPTFPIKVDQSSSSQFLSGLILNSWNLPFDLAFDVNGTKVSEGYLDLTIAFVKQLGMEIKITGNSYLIPEGQKISQKEIAVEMDYSSAFPIACAAALSGQARILNASSKSLQPDSIFVNILKEMSVPIKLQGADLFIKQSENLSALEVNLKSSPDLFPVLSVLCSFALGTSKLYGAPQLEHKESNRLQKTAELLKLAGVHFNELPDGLEIQGNPDLKAKAFSFNPDHDHRMAMAAALFKIKDFEIKISDHEVVNKSYPQFWKELGVSP